MILMDTLTKALFFVFLAGSMLGIGLNTEHHAVPGRFVSFLYNMGGALENARLFEESLSRASELDERSQRLGLLNRFSSALGGLLDEGKILQLTAQELLDALQHTPPAIRPH